MTAAENALARFVRRPPALTGLMRGLKRKCPHCGDGKAFNGYLTLASACGECGAPLGQIRADDAPPYFTITLVGHIILPLVLIAERLYQPSLWTHAAIWPALTIALTLGTLPLVKGGVVGVMWAVGLKGDEHH